MLVALDSKALEPSFATWHVHLKKTHVVHHFISGYLVSLGRLGAASGQSPILFSCLSPMTPQNCAPHSDGAPSVFVDGSERWGIDFCGLVMAVNGVL